MSRPASFQFKLAVVGFEGADVELFLHVLEKNTKIYRLSFIGQ